MDFSEKVLEDIIWDNAQSHEGRKLLKERGLFIRGKLFRQLELGNYGRADLVSIEYIPHSDVIDVVVYELKKGCINVNALMQVARYVTALKSHGLDVGDWCSEIHISMCLIGDAIDKNGDFAFLYNDIDNVEIYSYDYRLDGLYFCEVEKNWCRTEENINEDTIGMITEYLESEMIKADTDDSDK